MESIEQSRELDCLQDRTRGTTRHTHEMCKRQILSTLIEEPELSRVELGGHWVASKRFGGVAGGRPIASSNDRFHCAGSDRTQGLIAQLFLCHR